MCLSSLFCRLVRYPCRFQVLTSGSDPSLFSGEKGRRIRELTSLVQKRFNFPEGTVELYAEKVNNRGLCAIAQAESLRYKLLGGLAVRRYIPFRLFPVYYFFTDLIWRAHGDYRLILFFYLRRACYGVLRFVMESGAKGCEVRNHTNICMYAIYFCVFM